MPSVRSVLAFAGALFAFSVPTSAWAADSCAPRGYSYAGVASLDRAFGVEASVETMLAPVVAEGHVAAWVGVGGPGFGPHGEDEWVQVGVNSLPGMPNALYYEVARPGQTIEYGELEGSAVAGTRHRVAVLELPRHPGWWEVWVDGGAAAGPFFLPGSNGAWEPIATAESWGAGARCNRFAYRFDDVALATRPGGAWQRLRRASAFADAGYRVIRRAAASFTAVARGR